MASVRLCALAPVASAVVVDVLSLFQLADKQAAAMAAMDQARESEIVLHFPGLVLGSSIQQFLDSLPTFAGHHWFVSAVVRGAVPVEIAGVQPLSKGQPANASAAGSLVGRRVEPKHLPRISRPPAINSGFAPG